MSHRLIFIHGLITETQSYAYIYTNQVIQKVIQTKRYRLRRKKDKSGKSEERILKWSNDSQGTKSHVSIYNLFKEFIDI